MDTKTEHSPGVQDASDGHPGCLGFFLVGASPRVETDAFVRLFKQRETRL